MPRNSTFPNPPRSQLKLTAAAALLLFFSGAIALAYEVTWQRQFALVLGSNAAATSAVLASFFAGLGLGSWLIGHRARKWRRPLVAFAALEFGVGLGALLVAPMLRFYESFYPLLFERFSTNPLVFVLLKILLAFLALALPTICMGGTLPVLGYFAAQLDRRLGISAGLLYAVNTFGAALGALAVPFLLLPNFGTDQLTWLCATGNSLVALLAFALSKISSAPSPAVTVPSPSTPMLRPLLFLSALSGFATFALQVGWNRAFAQVHENSIYSFPVITATFIAALALGAQLARLALQRWNNPRQLLAWAWIAGGLLSWLSPWILLKLTENLSYLPSGQAWAGYGLDLLKLSLLVLALPVTALGMGLPLLMEYAGNSTPAHASKTLGRLLGANIIGTVLGALTAGFILPAFVTLWVGIALVSTTMLAAGLALRSKPLRPSWPALATSLALAAFLCWITGAANLPRVKISPGETILKIAEGTHGIAAVVERPNSRRLKLNNYYVLGGTSSIGDERMQAHLPLLLHPHPNTAAFLGVGTAITSGGALFHPLDQLTLVELVPEVLNLAREFFPRPNNGILQHPRATIIRDDARNFLRGTSRKFDVIISDLVVPWRQGEGALYTLEHFLAARRCLNPAGLFCLWVPCFQLSQDETEMILRTFLHAFPQVALFRGDFSPDQPALALVASAEPPSLSLQNLDSRLAALRDPANPHLIHPAALWMHFAGALDRSWPGSQRGPLNTESKPLLELLGPLQHAGGRTAALLTGQRLADWLLQFKDTSASRVLLSSPLARSSSQAGQLLAQMTLAMSEGNRANALAAQAKLKELLPPELFSSLFP